MKKIREVLLASLLLLSMTGLIVYSKYVSEAVLRSVKRCVGVIVPSLFAFMALSGFMIRSGVITYISKPFDLTVGKLLKLPAGTSGLLLISNIAGYPVGASMLADAVRKGKIDRRCAEIMSVFCYAGGPAYLINAVGTGIFGSKKAGLSVFLSILTANLLLAAVMCRIYKPTAEIRTDGRKVSSEDLICSVTDAGEKIFDMCFMIIWFSAILAAAEGTGLPARIGNTLGLTPSEGIMIRSMFEITSSSALDKNAYGLLPWLAVLCSFGGVCVILQLKTVIKGSFGSKLFWKWMPIRGVLVYSLNRIYNWIFLDDNMPAFARDKEIIVELDNLLPSLCLIMMIFILVLQKRLDFLKRV